MNALTAWALIQGSNALNIIAGIIVAHLVVPYDFGRFATLSAAITIMTAVLNPMINELAQKIAAHRIIERGALRSRTYIAVAACCLISFLSCASIVSTRFEAITVYLLIPIVLVGQGWVCGILYGLHRMITAGAVLCASGAVRVGILVSLLYIWDAFGGISLSYLAGFLFTIVASFFFLGATTAKESETAWITNWKLLFGFFVLALPFSVDQPIVQALFPNSSADYAALMTYARSVMFLASPALTLAYTASLQKESTGTEQRSSRRLSPLVTTAGLASALALSLWLVHPFLFPLLLGKTYVHVTPHLAMALLGMTLYVISYFLVQRMLLACSWWLCGVLIIPLLIQALLLALQESPTIGHLTAISVVTFAVQCCIACGAHYVYHRAKGQS